MFEQQSSMQKLLVKYSLLTLFCSLLAWVAALVNGLLVIRDAAIGYHYITRIGPFTLNELTKLPLTDGYTIRLRFLHGLLSYIFCSTLLGFTIGYIISRTRQN
jgi:hypothetical protein